MLFFYLGSGLGSIASFLGNDGPSKPRDGVINLYKNDYSYENWFFPVCFQWKDFENVYFCELDGPVDFACRFP